MNLLPFVFLLFAAGLYCLLTQKNLIKLLIGLELLGKSTTLAIVWSGVVQKNSFYMQSIAIIVIAVEVIVVAIMLALIYEFHQKKNTLDTDELQGLKG